MFLDFCRAMICISVAYAVVRCLSVRPSRSWTLSKRINRSSIFFSPSGSHTILVFFYTKRYGNIPTGTPLTVALNAGGVNKIRDSRRISVYPSLSAGASAINN